MRRAGLIIVFLLGFAMNELHGNERPRVLELRQEENWFTLHDKKPGASALDSVKFIMLSSDPAWFLTLGGEARLIQQVFINEAFGDVPQDKSGTFLMRLLPHINLSLGHDFRFFIEFISAFEHGRDAGPRIFDRDDFDLSQAFLEFTPGNNRAGTPRLTIRLGRQALQYGAGRMISVREGPSTRRSFDSALVRYESKRFRLDTFTGLEVSIKPEVFDDEYNENQVLWGVYATVKASGQGVMNFDAYYIGVKQSPVAYSVLPGEEIRHTLGVRPSAKQGNWIWDLEVLYQFGVFKTPARRDQPLINKNHHRIRAGGFAMAVAYQFTKTTWKPRITLDAGYASGDKDAKDRVVNTFRSPAPNLRFAGTTSSLGPANTMGLNPAIAVFPLPGLILELTARFLWRADIHDGLHSPGGFPVRPPATSRPFIGGGISLFAAMGWNDYLSSFAMAEYFQPGALLRLRSPGKEVYFFMIGSTFKI